MPATWIHKKHREQEFEEEVGFDIEEGITGIPGEYTHEKVDT